MRTERRARRRGFRAGAALLAVALAVAVGAWSRGALASPIRGEFTCPIQSSGDCSVLPRRLFLIRGSMPDDPNDPEQRSLECQNDEDGNGLDDAMERRLACCFAPRFWFDNAEPKDSLQPDEPMLVFHAQVESDTTDERVVRLYFVALWRKDGGFVGAPHIGCLTTDDHKPDSQGFHIDIRRGSQPNQPWGLLDWGGGGLNCDYPLEVHPNLAGVLTHPMLYASAGKHHFRCNADPDNKCTPSHADNFRMPTRFFHLPQIFSTHGSFATAAESGTILNFCELTRTGNLVAADRLGPFYLQPLGIDGNILQRYFIPPNAFGKNQVDGVASQVKFDGMDDFDNDTLHDMSGLTATAVNCGGATYGKCDNLVGDAKQQCLYEACHAAGPCYFTKDPVTHHYVCRGQCNVYSPGLQGDCVHHDLSVTWKIGVRAPDDMCPDAAPAAGDDGDNDKIENACDPDLFFDETYVAGGDKSYPTIPSNDIIDDAWTGMYPSHWKPSVPRQGFLDTDVDGVPDGEDFCPLDNHYPYGYPFFDDNSWGEDVNWPWTTGPAGTPRHTAGELHRGNPCDPYPLGITGLVPEVGYGSACSDSFHPASAGDDEPGYTVYQENGTSINGAKVDGTVNGQTYRCACRNHATDAPYATLDECLDDQHSDCVRRDVVVADPATAQGRGYLPVERAACGTDPDGYCSPYLMDPREHHWDWLGEYFRTPGHFHQGDIVASLPHPPINPQLYWYARFPYALMTVTAIHDAPANVEQAGSPFPDPAHVAGYNVLMDTSSTPSRRLRATFAGGMLRLSSEHQVQLPPDICNDPFHLGFAAVWAQYQCIIGCDPLDLSKWWEDPDPFQLVQNDTTVSGLVLVRPREGYTSSIVTDGTAQELLGSSAVLAAPMPTGPASVGPDLMVLGTSDVGTSWLRLAQGFALDNGGGLLGAPIDAELAAPATTPAADYYTVESGQLPVPLVEGSRLLSDPRTDWVGLFVPGSGVWGYNPVTASWRNAGAPLEVVSRGEPALAMVGGALVVAGGVTEEGTATDAWAVSLAGHGAQLLTTSLPPRRNALLTVKADSSGFAYGGGFDDSGAARDDVWSLDREPGGALSARLVAADTGRALALTPDTAGLDLPPLGGPPRLYRLDRTEATGVTHELRTGSGWSQLDLYGAAMPACSGDDTHGGEACRLDPAWWSDAGTRSCADSAQPGACTGARGELLASQTLPAGREPDAVWAGHGAVWVLAGRRLERWDATTPGAAVLSASAWLPKAGTMLAGRGSEVLVGTKAGVQRAALGEDGLSLGPVLELCGHPRAAAAVGDDTWAVVTEFGLFTLSTPPDAAPGVLAQAEIGVDGGATVVRPVSGCGGFGHDHDGPGQGESGIDDNAVVKVEDPAHVFVVLKRAIAEVDLTDLTAPVGARGLALPHRIDALRLDTLQGRAYGAGAQLLPIVDLRGDALSISGEHQLDGWVRRSDATLHDGTRLSARVDGERVKVAWVAP